MTARRWSAKSIFADWVLVKWGAEAAFLVAASALPFVACQSVHSYPRTTITSPTETVSGSERDQPCVVHVCGDSGLRAGTPIDNFRVLTTIYLADTTVPAIAVDGQPMMFTIPNGTTMAALRRKPIGEFPFLQCVSVAYRAFDHSAFQADATIDSGQRITVSGYFNKKPSMDARDFLRLTPSHVEVSLANGPDVETMGPSNPILWLSAPDGDYAAFSGGPVAVWSANERPTVVAIILFQDKRPHADSVSRVLLAAQPIPISLADRSRK